MISLLDLIGIFVALFIVVLTYYKWSFKHWERKKLPYLEPKFPLGCIPKKRMRVGDIVMEWYKEIKRRGHKHGGAFLHYRPVYIPVDPDYIKNILIKDFQHFTDRGLFHDEKTDPLSAHLFNMDGPQWKYLRGKLTPTFSSGKMKMMFDTLVQCTGPFLEAMDKFASGCKPIDIKELLSCFTTDVIGSCAFGIDCNSFADGNCEFRRHGANVFKPRSKFWEFKRFLRNELPKLGALLRLRALEDDDYNFFMNMVAETIEYREKNSVERSDFMQLLIGLMKGQGLNFNQIAAQAFVFFIAGFETSSTTMTFAMYEMAVNPDMQRRVREEVKEVLGRHEGRFTYEGLGEMTYLQQVIDETLRKHSPAELSVRFCSKDYLIPNTDVVVDKGTRVFVPIKGLHMDEEYFPEPEKFDPERFNAENKSKIKAGTYLPFGDGPRNCIGLRFGLMQTKVGLAVLLKNYHFTLNEKTVQPLKMVINTFIPTTEGGIWLNATKVDQKIVD
nr:cytochrome P450 monooxygenase [Lasioderma serricorne]